MDERFLEYAQGAVQAEQERSIQQVSCALNTRGRIDCVDCGEEIEPARREAAPFAVRCITCQQMTERRR